MDLIPLVRMEDALEEPNIARFTKIELDTTPTQAHVSTSLLVNTSNCYRFFDFTTLLFHLPIIMLRLSKLSIAFSCFI